MLKRQIDVYEETWSGKNKKCIEKFFKTIKYDEYSFLEHNGELLLYDNDSLVSYNTIITGSVQFGIIGKVNIIR